MSWPWGYERLTEKYYARPPAVVARSLLGKYLLRTDLQIPCVGGRIVETEAYLSSGDKASHSARGKTASNASMFGPPGLLYVYSIHGKYCLNAVTEQTGRGSAVLIRAIEPLFGIEMMQTHRDQNSLLRLTRGPAMLCQACQVDRKLDGISLTSDPRLGVFEKRSIKQKNRQEGKRNEDDHAPILATPRIGVSKDADLKLRFVLRSNRFASGPQWMNNAS